MGTFDNVPLEAKAVGRLVCTATGRTVGVEYLWETGQTSTLWVDAPCENAVLQPIAPKTTSDG